MINVPSPMKFVASVGEIPLTKFRYLVDIHTFRLRISKMQMQVIIDRFFQNEKSYQYNLTGLDCRFLESLASMMGNKTSFSPSYEYLMKLSRIGSKSTLNKSIKKLESLKILIVKRAHNKNNEYFFNKSFIDSFSIITEIGVQKCTSRVQKCTPGGTKVYANNKYNNKIDNNRVSIDSKYTDMTDYQPSENGKTISPNHRDFKK